MRPRSIILFEVLSLTAVALGVLVLAMSWDALMVSIYSRIRGAGIEPAMIILAALYVSLLILLILLASRRGSAVAKWLLTAIVLAGAVTTVPNLPAMARGGIVGWTQLLQLLVQLAGLWFLFAPASRAWVRGGATA